jgi:glycerol kinase
MGEEDASMKSVLLAIDQGTTSSRAILFDQGGKPLAVAQQEFTQHFPDDGWVEHDPGEIWQTTQQACTDVLAQVGGSAPRIAAIGITNQRETTVVWDKETGKPVYPAIVWQDRRTAGFCEQLRRDGLELMVRQKTGLLLDPYFSASKIRWILKEVEGARQKAESGRLLFGTIDTWLLWQLTGGKQHLTDATNASRTLLFNIHDQQWDEELLELFGIPAAILPEVKDSSADYGVTTPDFPGGAITIGGIAGDQQAALFGQACFQAGMAKSTYGTGCFLMLNTGEEAVVSDNRLLTTVASRLAGKVSYALEGSIFNAGTAVQWLRDGLGLIRHASESEGIAERTGDGGGVYLVPAFTGLGAPYWDPNARGALLGLTRDSGRDQVITATLQSIAYQTRDLVEAMAGDGVNLEELRVDGGMVANNWLMQFLSDTLAVPIQRPRVTETTALGAALLAGMQQGVYGSVEEITDLWQAERLFAPAMPEERRHSQYSGWLEAVVRVTSS